jgi:hypothetical protein
MKDDRPSARVEQFGIRTDDWMIDLKYLVAATQRRKRQVATEKIVPRTRRK